MSLSVGNTSWPDPGRAWFMLAVLHLAYLISFMDRTILSLLVDPIKASLGLSDTQMGLLHGLAFGLLYTVLGIPFGIIADRANRKWLITAGVSFWSMATAICGLANNFIQLFLARMAVGVGEATLNPSAVSLIADYFPESKRPLALGIYQMAASVGLGVALLAGGLITQAVMTMEAFHLPLLGELEPWRVVFLLVGLPGLLVVGLILLVQEPVRVVDRASRSEPAEFWLFMKKRANVMAPHFIGFTLFTVFAYGVMSWVPAYFMRTFAWTPAEVGLRYGTVFLIFGSLGALAGGVMASALKRRGDSAAEIKVVALGFLCMIVPGILAPLQSSQWAALAIMAPVAFLFGFPSGVSAAFIQSLTPNRLRGRVVAIYYFCINLFGSTLGALLIGLFNDYLFVAEDSLGKSLALLAAICMPLATILTVIAWRNWQRDEQLLPAGVAMAEAN